MKNINVKHLKFMLLVIIFILTGCSNKSSRNDLLEDRFFYYDKDTLNIYEDIEYDQSPRFDKIGNTEYKQRYYKDDKDIEVSPNGKFVYYIRYKNAYDNVGELVRDDLYLHKMQVQNKSKTPIYRKTKVIASDVSSFDMLFSGNVLYYSNKSHKISIWDGEKSKVIASDIDNYKVDYYENILLLSMKNKNVYDLYLYYLNVEGAGIKLIEKGVDNLVGTSKTFDKIYYTKIDEDRKNLYCVRYFEDINIVKNGDFIDYLVNQDTGNIYFTISKGETKYGTVYYYDSSEKKLTKVNDNSYINNIIDGKNLSDIVFIKTESKSYLFKSGDLLEFKNTENIEHMYSRPEDMTLFYISRNDSNKKYDLYSIFIQGEELPEPEKIDTEVESVDKLYYGNIYYYKKGSDGRELYKSGRKLRTNVQKTFYLYGNIYIACDKKKDSFTLYRLLYGKLQLVGTNIHSFIVLNKGYIAYIKDLDDDNGGKLFLWGEGRTQFLSDQVMAIGNELSLNRDIYEKE